MESLRNWECRQIALKAFSEKESSVLFLISVGSVARYYETNSLQVHAQKNVACLLQKLF